MKLTTLLTAITVLAAVRIECATVLTPEPHPTAEFDQNGSRIRRRSSHGAATQRPTQPAVVYVWHKLHVDRATRIEHLHHMYSPLVQTLVQFCDGTSTSTSTSTIRRCNITRLTTPLLSDTFALPELVRSLPLPDVFIAIGQPGDIAHVPWEWLGAKDVLRILCTSTKQLDASILTYVVPACYAALL